MSTPPLKPPPPPFDTTPTALSGYGKALLPLALALVGLVVALSTRNLRMAFFQVLPAVLAMLLGGGGAALYLLRRPRAPLWYLMLGTALATTLALLLTVLGLSVLHGKSPQAVFLRPVVERGLLAAPLLGALIGAALWQLARARAREHAAWQAEHEARARHLQLEHRNTVAQLQLLQAQIEPHFIYNTLANLRQLVRQDSARALQMLDQLIRYFKLVLPSFRAEQLPLRDEIALVQAYLELLSTRMDRCMHLSVELPEAIAHASLLPGALLCLAENAIKHGLPEDGSALQLQVRAQLTPPTLILAVRDNGPGIAATPRSGGTGLANLRNRLHLLYGEQASLQLRPCQPGCEAIITLPWEAAHAPERKKPDARPPR